MNRVVLLLAAVALVTVGCGADDDARTEGGAQTVASGEIPFDRAFIDAMVPHLGESLQVRLSKTDNLSFSVLDGERVVLGVKNPLDPRNNFAVVHMDHRAFAADLVGKFD